MYSPLNLERASRRLQDNGVGHGAGRTRFFTYERRRRNTISPESLFARSLHNLRRSSQTIFLRIHEAHEKETIMIELRCGE